MRTLLTLLLVVNALLLPLGCCALSLVVPAPFNPFAIAFVTQVSITNALDAPILVTPVGTVGSQGDRAPLPLMKQPDPAYPSDRLGGFKIEPGGTWEMFYDWDDINFSELVITFDDGSSRQLVVDPNPTANQYHEPYVNRLIIDDPSKLEPVAPAVQAAAIRADRASGPYWGRFAWVFVPWLTFPALLLLRRRLTPRPASPADPPKS